MNLDGDSMGDACDPDDDGDGIADTGDNCPVIANASQANLDGDSMGDACDPDMDGDGFANGGDCAPVDPLNRPPQTEVTGLELSGGESALLQWAPHGQAGAYDVLTGNSGGLAGAGGVGSETCIGSSLSATQTTDARMPGPDSSFYYLIRPRNACGAGPLGVNSTGQPRSSNACQ